MGPTVPTELAALAAGVPVAPVGHPFVSGDLPVSQRASVKCHSPG
jgi:hypothetical protein